jgi:hypothetical protein
MSGLRSLNNTLLALLISAAPATAFGAWSSECKSSANSAKQACEGAAAAAKGGDAGDTAKNMARFGNANEIKNPATAMQQHGTANAQRFTQAKNTCEEKHKECESTCKRKEGERSAAEANPQTQAAAKADKAPMQEGEKVCAAILPLIAELGAGAGQAAQAAADAGKTGGSSGMMPMPIPIPSGDKGDQTGAPTQGNNPTSDQINCDAEGNSRYSDCNNHYIGKCENAMTAAGCDGFINRYCGNYNPAPAPAPAPGNDSLSLSAQSTAATANLVADKQGEGLGSAFCKKATAYKFCQMAGRSECPSCKNLNSPWAGTNQAMLADAQNTCPTDPMFLDAAVQQQMNNPTADTNTSTNTGSVATQSLDRLGNSAGSAAGGAGGGMSTQSQGSGGAGSVTPGQGSGISEGYNGPSLAMGTGYGGGGGGSYEGGASGPGYQPESVNGNTNRAPSSVTVPGEPRDVARQYGPSIFSIQSTTYRDMCNRGRFLHCRK